MTPTKIIQGDLGPINVYFLKDNLGVAICLRKAVFFEYD